MNTDMIAARWRCLTAPLSRRGALVAAMLLAAGSLTSGIAGTEARYQHTHHHHHKHRNRKRHDRHTRRKRPSGQAPTSPPITPPAPVPETRPDATCASPGLGVNVLADPNSRLAQTFTALASGKLVRADLDIASPSGSEGDFVLRLSPVQQSGETLPPTNNVLAEASVVATNVPNQVSTITFSFWTPFSVVAGTTYALVLSRPGGDQFAWFGQESDVCDGGVFISPDQSAGFIDTSGDLVFTTFVSS